MAKAKPPVEPETVEVVGFKRDVLPDGRVVETEFLSDGRERVTQQRQVDE